MNQNTGENEPGKNANPSLEASMGIDRGQNNMNATGDLEGGRGKRTRRFVRLLVCLILGPAAGSVAGATEGVVLLHGLCRTTKSMEKMEAALSATGFVVENIGYDSRHHSIAALSEQVMSDVASRARLRECSKIHFVTHSLGGLLVRSYLKRHDFERLGRVVMLAPPNQGSEVVDKIGSWYLFRKINGPAGSELGTADESTPNQLGPVGFECGVIAGDRSINWINSLMIAGKDDGKVSIERTKVEGMKDHRVLHVSHPFIMEDHEAIQTTIRFLRHGNFREMGEDLRRFHSLGASGKPVWNHDT